MNKVYGLILLSIVAAPAAAQTMGSGTASFLRGWEGEQAISLSPRVGKALPFDADESPVDESEFEASILARKMDVAGLPKIQFKVGATTSAHFIADGDPESGLYAEAAVGDAPLTLQRVFLHSERTKLASKVADYWRPYGKYRYTRLYNGSFEDHARDEHQFTVGVRYRNVVSIMAKDAGLPAADHVDGDGIAYGAASNVVGVYFEARAELNDIQSTVADEERFYPTLRFDVYSRPFEGGIRTFGRAQGDWFFYHHARAGLLSEKRQDKRLRLTAGLDLSELLERAVPGISVELAGQFQQRWSNDSAKEHKRAYFVPSFELATTF